MGGDWEGSRADYPADHMMGGVRSPPPAPLPCHPSQRLPIWTLSAPSCHLNSTSCHLRATPFQTLKDPSTAHANPFQSLPLFFSTSLLHPSTGFVVKPTIHRLIKKLGHPHIACHSFQSSIKSHLADKVLELGSVGVETINVGVESELAEGLPGRLVPVDVHWVQRTKW